jgi:small-conductance mechanosensitive channel
MSARSVLDQAANALGGYLPRLAGALLLLVLGVLVVRGVARLVVRGLRGAGLDDLGERWHMGDVLGRVGLPRSLAAVLGGALRLAGTIVVVFAALSLLGLEFLSASLNAGIVFLPRLFTALVLLLVGALVAQLARRQVDRLAGQMDLPGPLGALAEVVVLAVFAVTALAQIGIPIEVLLLLVGIILTAVALTLTLAFGLGGREVARELSARRHVERAYAVGQEISVEGVRGRIVAIESTSTLLDTASGERLRVPNSRLLAAVVTLHG